MQFTRPGSSGLTISRIGLGMSYCDTSRTATHAPEHARYLSRHGESGDSGAFAELLFEVLTEREEKSAIAIASNEPFSGWTKTFADPRLCAAIVDRLTFAEQIIETGTTGYRLAHARATRARK